MANPTKREGAVVEVPDAVLASFRPETASPDDVARLIAARIQRLDREIGDALRHAEELQAERKQWVSISGSNVPQPTRNGEAT